MLVDLKASMNCFSMSGKSFNLIKKERIIVNCFELGKKYEK